MNEEQKRRAERILSEWHEGKYSAAQHGVEMASLLHEPVGKAHPHRITCYIEALERGLVKRGAGRHWFWGLKIERIEQEQSE